MIHQAIDIYFHGPSRDCSPRPLLAAQACEKPVVATLPTLAEHERELVAGYCDLDATFIGWGGRHGVVTPIRTKCYGLIVSREQVKWGNSPQRERYGGLAGLPGIVSGIAEDKHPLDSPACVHFIPHLGYVGLVWSLRWGQIVDFVVGFTTIDLDGDDG